MNLHVYKDILTVEEGYILQQVNLKGVMGAGLARSIAVKWPQVLEQYRASLRCGYLALGSIQIIAVAPSLYVVNLVGQAGYGRDRRYTDYAALERGLKLAAVATADTGLPVYIPYKMGCGLGGGDWGVVTGLIATHLPKAIVCMKENGI